MEKQFLALFDFDGTLFNTHDANYYAYKHALSTYGIDLDRSYFRDRCFGRNYRDFLPELLNDDVIIEDIHQEKMRLYRDNLDRIEENKHLFQIIECMREKYYIAIVTTASRQNTMDVLESHGYKDFFDLIITQDNVTKMKPDPECYVKAMDHFGISPVNTVIFEDSDVGIRAAEASGASVFVVKSQQWCMY